VNTFLHLLSKKNLPKNSLNFFSKWISVIYPYNLRPSWLSKWSSFEIFESAMKNKMHYNHPDQIPQRPKKRIFIRKNFILIIFWYPDILWTSYPMIKGFPHIRLFLSQNHNLLQNYPELSNLFNNSYSVLPWEAYW